MKKLLLIALAPLLSFASTPIEVKFLSDENTNSGTVVLSVKNNSKQDIELLKWNTPFEKTLSSDVFNVNINGKENLYMGRTVKRIKPKDSDYILLQSGISEKITVDLSKYYEMKRRGEYNIEFDGTFQYRILDTTDVKRAKVIKEEFPKTKLFFNPSAKQKRAFTPKKKAQFEGCSQNDIKVLKTAHIDAITMSKKASEAMNNAGKKTSAERYTTWFGKADEKRQKIVTDAFSKIYDAFENKDLSFDCGTCKKWDKERYDETFAYVHPNSEYEIYLCGAFWKSSTTGTDTQAGTLIHEVSHFTTVAGTGDFAYQQTPAKDLAKKAPNKAVNNAENYDYFAENNPKLSMDKPNGENNDNTEDNNNSIIDDNNYYDSTEEDEDWNKCLELKSDKEIDNCFIKWEDKYYPNSEDWNNEDWNDEDFYEDNGNWDNIDWNNED